MSAHGADIAVASTPAALAELRTFHTLDALRGVAALTVVLYHASFFYGIGKPVEGGMAVDLFFVMSGFIIAHRYEADLKRCMGLWRFIQVRLIRLYPLFILGAFLGFVPALIAVVAGHTDPTHEGMVESFGLAVFMLPSWFAYPKLDWLYPLNGVAWSLALEVVVNILYAATVRVWTVRRLLVVLGLSFVGLCVCAAVYGDLGLGYTWGSSPIGIARIAFAFTAGLLIQRLHAHQPIRSPVPWWVLPLIAVALFTFAVPVARPLWQVFAIGLLVPGIVVLAIAVEPPKAWRGVCALAGVYSYVLYSLHLPLVGFFLRGEDRLHLGVDGRSPLRALALTLLIAGVCVAAHVFYDKPVRRLLMRRLSRRPIVVAPIAALPAQR